MTHCPRCGQPVHPHQRTCGSCGVALPARESGVRPEEAEGRADPGPPSPRDAGLRPGSERGAGPESRPGPPSGAALDPRPFAPSDPDDLHKPEDEASFTLDDLLELGEEHRERAPARAAPERTRRGGRRRARARPRGPVASPAFFSRAWALVVDATVLALASAALPAVARAGIRLAELASGQTELYDDVLTEQLTTVGRIALVASYFVFMTAGAGQTLGKGLMGLHVVRADGRPPDALVSLLRFVGYAFSALPFGFGFLLAAFTPRRALHDYLAGTVVVRPRDMPQTASEDLPP